MKEIREKKYQGQVHRQQALQEGRLAERKEREREGEFAHEGL